MTVKDKTRRYTRHALLEGWSQEVVEDSTVFMIGVGALGCEIAKNLALVGVGKMIIVDDDTIETSNLSRQMLFLPGTEGRPKAEVAAETLKKFNPYLEVEHHFGRLQKVSNSVYEKSDVIIGGLDSIKARLDLNNLCLRMKKILIDGATLGFEGHVHVVIPEGADERLGGPTACLRCLIPVPPADEQLIAACTPKGTPKKLSPGTYRESQEPGQADDRGERCAYRDGSRRRHGYARCHRRGSGGRFVRDCKRK